MDIVDAIHSLGKIRDELSYEELIEAKRIINSLEDDLGSLTLFLDQHDVECEKPFLDLLECWDIIKRDLLNYFS